MYTFRMTHADAIDFLGRAGGPWQGIWADLGAGKGTFTRALAELIGPQGTVIAVDHDRRAVAQLRGVAQRADPTWAGIAAVQGDMQDPDSIRELDGGLIDGALFANALHFTASPGQVLARTARHLRANGRIVVIEYDRTRPNPWVPHPLPFSRLVDVTRLAGLGIPVESGRRPSAYHREMYLAVIG